MSEPNDITKVLLWAQYGGMRCSICTHKYTDVDDMVKRDVVRSNSPPAMVEIACRECYRRRVGETAVLLETGEEVEIAHTVFIRGGKQLQGTQGLLDYIDELEAENKRLLERINNCFALGTGSCK